MASESFILSLSLFGLWSRSSFLWWPIIPDGFLLDFLLYDLHEKDYYRLSIVKVEWSDTINAAADENLLFMDLKKKKTMDKNGPFLRADYLMQIGRFFESLYIDMHLLGAKFSIEVRFT